MPFTKMGLTRKEIGWEVCKLIIKFEIDLPIVKTGAI